MNVLFYFGFWPLAFGSSICHAELVSASHREPLLVFLRGQILKRVQDDGGWCRLLAISFFSLVKRASEFSTRSWRRPIASSSHRGEDARMGRRGLQFRCKDIDLFSLIL